MYIRKTRRKYKGKTYTNHLLVESVHTQKGPRQRTVCSLGSLAPGPAEDWLALARKLESALHEQEFQPVSSYFQIPELGEKVRKAKNFARKLCHKKHSIKLKKPWQPGEAL